MKISVIALGLDVDDLTLGAIKTLQEADKIILRTGRCAAGEYLTERNIPFETLDSYYESASSFDELDERSAGRVLECAEQEKVCLGVFDPATDTLVRRLGTFIGSVAPSASPAGRFAGCLSGSELRVATAAGLRVDTAQGDLVITEVDSRLIAGEIKLKLTDIYGEQHKVCFCEKPDALRWMALRDIDRQDDACYSHRCMILLPEISLAQKSRFDFTDLVHLMAVLRSPGGCSWDMEQTHESLRTYLIEEAYETAAAIDEEDWLHAAEELGDVLLQVVFQANIGNQYGTFSLGDITTAICSKMIRRHPHVFGQANGVDASTVSAEWERIKAEERRDETASDSMLAVSRGLPSLMRAEKVLKRASTAGFGADTPWRVLDEIKDVLERIGKDFNSDRDERLEKDFGDLLLGCVDLIRLSGIESEGCLMRAVEGFIKCFKRMEELAASDNLYLNTLTINEMGVYWCRARQDLHECQ